MWKFFTSKLVYIIQNFLRFRQITKIPKGISNAKFYSISNIFAVNCNNYPFSWKNNAIEYQYCRKIAFAFLFEQYNSDIL